jgi:hypothetical protein
MSERVLKSENITQEESETLRQAKTQTEIEKQTEAQTESQAQTMTETRSVMLSPPLGKPFDAFEEIRKLADQPITLETIMDRKLIYGILLAENEARLMRNCMRRYNKWLEKRGRNLSKDAQEKQSEYMWIKYLIETTNRYVTGAFGIVGSACVTYHGFMLQLYSKLKRAPILEWSRKAEELIALWSIKPNIDKKALRTCAHMLLKLMAYLTQP